jgi:hypothetical protein
MPFPFPTQHSFNGGTADPRQFLPYFPGQVELGGHGFEVRRDHEIRRLPQRRWKKFRIERTAPLPPVRHKSSCRAVSRVPGRLRVRAYSAPQLELSRTAERSECVRAVTAGVLAKFVEDGAFLCLSCLPIARAVRPHHGGEKRLPGNAQGIEAV